MAKLLIAAQPLATGVVKGDIVEVYPDVYGWGNKEGLPNFIRATITDKTDDEVRNYLQNVDRSFDYSINVQNAQNVRATVRTDDAVGGAIDQEVKQEVKDYILSGGALGLSVTLHAQTGSSLTVNIALPNDENRIPTLQQFKDDINDKFSEQIGYRRYYFDPITVDSVIAAGGEWSGTAAQALNNIVDRFA